ncbi:acyl-CoA dehydrogenase [Maritalea mediterranea]|uniref:Acyl-coenzyme A dehydrogenase n=1 Tax=Maritalea mediterranea TaxID=2909667 RepID=A0ABS9EBT2_9HYPH|nr:acyl-CoA dehydrogenase [Maritalea mediterranea]MCF4099609.1 acyl-CoA dehydrogenase [Maritalea mediterranea]
MTLMMFLIFIVGFVALAVTEAKLVFWGLAALVYAAAALALGGALSLNIVAILTFIPGVVFLLLSVPMIRRLVLTNHIYKAVKKILPRVSRTEQEALDAGTVGWDAELFSGRPKWNKLLDIEKPHLTEEEQAFLDGPTEVVCKMIDDWDTRHNRADMPEEVWQYLKDNGFLGMLISKEHGGLGFSAQAQSMIVSKIAGRSIAAGITVMVPNSLGPGELLEKYGTPEQKDKYLERLATGKEVPCFGLTAPHAGSDAAGMRDVGVVCEGMHEGKKVLGVKLNWEKRYITLGPVATLLGLAFNLYDPENRLGKGTDVGITLALIPTDHEGVNIGRRHYPARSAFMNGPNSGKDVFIPLDWIIGGTEYCGQGWRMLMECLSTGRAISLPAIGTVSIKQALRVTSAYARIRRQFGISIGMMEGVAEPVARLVKDSYMFEGARATTAAMVDEGQKPSVISALLKYRTTDAMRERINDAMDVHGGRAVCDGPSNYLFAGYQAVPVAITVEGANILTRTLITFAQGALRAHPFLYKEISAAQNENKAEGQKAFDKAFAGHTGFMLRNILASFLHSVTFARFASSPRNGPTKIYYQRLHRYAQNFALVGDWVVAFLGGDLKRKQRISGRMADILSDLYLMSMTLKRWEDDGAIADDLPIVQAIAEDRFAAIEHSFDQVFNNFPNPVLRVLMRFLVFPLGRRAKGSSDRENYRLAKAILRHSEQRDRLTRDIFVSFDPEDRTGVLEDTLQKVEEAEEIEKRFIRALKKGEIARRLDRDAIDDAVEKGILNDNEAGILRAADEATDKVIRVDDFDFDELGADRDADKNVAAQ